MGRTWKRRESWLLFGDQLFGSAQLAENLANHENFPHKIFKNNHKLPRSLVGISLFSAAANDVCLSRNLALCEDSLAHNHTAEIIRLWLPLDARNCFVLIPPHNLSSIFFPLPETHKVDPHLMKDKFKLNPTSKNFPLFSETDSRLLFGFDDKIFLVLLPHTQQSALSARCWYVYPNTVAIWGESRERLPKISSIPK